MQTINDSNNENRFLISREREILEEIVEVGDQLDALGDPRNEGYSIQARPWNDKLNALCQELQDDWNWSDSDIDTLF